MNKRFAVNGFGRIGRLVFRHLIENGAGLDPVAINDIAPLDNLAYLLKYDSVHSRPKEAIEVQDSTLRWGAKEIRFLSERDPTNLPWEEMESALVDAQSTMTLGDHTVKVLAWYDNEWGYARRVADLAELMSQS